MFAHNRFAQQHHNIIVSKGYWDEPKELGTLLMLVVTEISKLFDECRVNKNEKIADVALRLYDLCAYYQVDLSFLPLVNECGLHDMISMLCNELEAERADIRTNFMYLKRCLSMTWLYAKTNNINLEYEMLRKSKIILYMNKKKF